MSYPVPAEPVDLLNRVKNWLTSRRVRYLICWLVCLGVTAQRWYHARYEFDTTAIEPADKRRADTNLGHTHIDFGGQWVFGRLAATGQFHSLYHRDAQWKVANAGYPLSRQSEAVRKYHFPKDSRPTNYSVEDVRTDAEYLMGCLMGDSDDREAWRRTVPPIAMAFAGGVDGNPFGAAAFQSLSSNDLTPNITAPLQTPILGGPLYPPTHAILYAPLGAIANPQTAYFTFQWVSLGAAFLSGWCVTSLSRGRIWWPVATAVILLYPGGRPGLDLGQNHYLTLAIVLSGWALAARGRHYIGGAVWGLLAFKPVWGLAFIIVPVLMRNWRFVVGTGVCGCLFVALTVPFVGSQGWENWLAIGSEASAKYDIDPNWTNLSRDVYGIPRRGMIDFGKPEQERVTPEVTAASFGSLGFVFLATVAVYLWRGDRSKFHGLSAGFLLLGAFLCCYRFMYYDAVLALVGLSALLANPRWTLLGRQGELTSPAASLTERRVRLFTNSFPLTVLVLLLVYDNILIGLNPQVTAAVGHHQILTTDADGNEKWVNPKLSAACDYNHAVDTLLVIALWAWCGMRLIRDGRRGDDEAAYAASISADSAAPTSGDRMSDSPTSTA